MKKLLVVLLSICLLVAGIPALAQGGPADTGMTPPGSGETPPTPPSGANPGGPMGTAPGDPPSGGMGGGMPGGSSSGQPDSYDAVETCSEDATYSGTSIDSTGTDENALLVTGGNVTVTDCTITRTSEDSSGGDDASFYGVGAAILVTGGTVNVQGATITTDASGGAGVFAYGDGIAYVSDTTITTAQNTSGGIHVAGGGTLYATNCTVETSGESAAAVRSDRGGGTMVVDGGTYTSNGSGSPAVYVTADISISNAVLTAIGSEALCLEGRNAVVLNDCTLSGDMQDLEQNDNTWTVILYQSMSGDSEVGTGSFAMTGGSLVSGNGGLFYTTNTDSVFTLENVAISAAEDCEYFLRCTGNSNQRGWGSSGSNGANCVFTAIGQEMDGLVLWDSISTLEVTLTEGTVFTGAVQDDESCAGSGGNGTCSVSIDSASTWIVTGDSVLTSLTNAGTIADADGNAVAIVSTDGTVLAEGTSAYTITVESYSEG